MVADAVFEKEYVNLAPRPFMIHILILPRKDNQVFGQTFSWHETIDAAADIYNGVSV